MGDWGIMIIPVSTFNVQHSTFQFQPHQKFRTASFEASTRTPPPSTVSRPLTILIPKIVLGLKGLLSDFAYKISKHRCWEREFLGYWKGHSGRVTRKPFAIRAREGSHSQTKLSLAHPRLLQYSFFYLLLLSRFVPSFFVKILQYEVVLCVNSGKCPRYSRQCIGFPSLPYITFYYDERLGASVC